MRPGEVQKNSHPGGAPETKLYFFTLGYTMYDTCSPADFEITTDIMMHILLNEEDEDEQMCVCRPADEKFVRTLGMVGPALSSKAVYVNQVYLIGKKVVGLNIVGLNFNRSKF